MIRTVLASAAATAVLLGSSAAVAGPVHRRTDLTLLYMAEAGYATAVTLRCNPPGAHIRRGRGVPDAARGRRPAGAHQAAAIRCTMIYAPITAQITGKWRGKKIAWSKTYGNTCEMTRATGVLFRF
jgi:hypothetical protein